MFKKKSRLLASILSLIVVMSLVFLVITASASKVSTTNNSYTGTAPKYVFLFIGDGMSYSQVYSAEAYKGKIINDPRIVGISKLNFTNFPIAGTATTYDASSICPDSASTATSISTGNKTLSGVINMDVTKTIKFKTIAESAKSNGYKVGIISSVSIDHATPAAFYAHQPTRNNYYDIGKELVSSNFDYFGGGGFLQQKGAKNDQKDILEIAKEADYKVLNEKSSILALDNTSGKVIATNAVLDSSKALPYEIDRSNDDLSLADYTKKGIDVLDNPKGFFMMVEGGKIDWTCHANDAATSIKDTIAFETAVSQAINFYNKHPKETLIIVTADHETGGMTLGFAGTGYSTFFDKLSYQKMSFDEFNKIALNYTSKTTKENVKLEDLLPAIKSSFGLIVSSDTAASSNPEMVLTAYEVKRLRDALSQSIIASKDRKFSEAENIMYGTYEPLSVTITHILNNKAGIGWTSYAHTGVPVPVFAQGLGQDLFNGYYDNTDIFKKLNSIMKLK